jgi:hypothetical protein
MGRMRTLLRALRWTGRRRAFRMGALVILCVSAVRLITLESLHGDRGLSLAYAFALVIVAALLAQSLLRSLIPGLAAADRARTAYRLTAAWRALRGHPVAYKVSTEGGGLTVHGADHAIVAGCVFTGIPADQAAVSTSSSAGL